MDITEEEFNVLSAFDREYYYNYKNIIPETHRTKSELQPLIKALKDKGFLKYGSGLLTEEGEAWGSGWTLTEAGLDARNAYEDPNQAAPTTDELRKKLKAIRTVVIFSKRVEDGAPYLVGLDDQATRKIEALLQAEVLKARISQAKEATQHRTYTFQPVGGISNIKYVALGDLERDLAELQAQASKKDSSQEEK